MPITKTYTCDQCGGTIEWGYHTVEYNTVKKPTVVMGWAQQPQEQAIFCSMECLGKSLQWWASKYDKEDPRASLT